MAIEIGPKSLHFSDLSSGFGRGCGSPGCFLVVAHANPVVVAILRAESNARALTDQATLTHDDDVVSQDISLCFVSVGSITREEGQRLTSSKKWVVRMVVR